MNSDTASKQARFISEQDSSRPDRAKPMLILYSVLAFSGIFGGIASLFVGIVCVVIHGAISQDIFFDRLSTFLLIAAIPMMLAGSIFLDEINKSQA